jgi:anti-sigma factor RsiW
MSEWGGDPLARNVGEDVAEAARREEQHRVLIDLLGAYADRELPPETTSQIEAHLVGCARCRRELSVHRAVRQRLGDEPPVAAPPALRARIAAAVASTPVPRQHPFPSRRALAALIGGGILVASIAAAAIIARRTEETRSGVFVAISPVTVPLLRDALDDYRRVTAGDLPGRGRDLDVVRDAVPFPVEPLRAPEVRLLAAWTADLSGEPAAVLAYRRGDRVVLEYLVSEERFFRDPAVRRAVRDGRVLGASAGRQGIAAWPTKAAGAILVGDLPADQLATLVTADLLARRVDRGAQ